MAATKIVQKSAKPPAAGMGRPKGAVNKTTAILKDALIQAAINAGGGGEDGMVEYLTMQARENPGPFLTLLGKVLPLQVSGEGENGEVIVKWQS
jgi:hypothetical protein